MNTQNIFSTGTLGIDIILDNSELYDVELVTEEWYEIDAVLDESEFYDYTLGDSSLDYIYIQEEVLIGTFIFTQDNFALITEDNYYIEYSE